MEEPLISKPHTKLSLLRILCICASTLGFESAFNALFSLSEPIMEKLYMSPSAKFACWLSGPIAGFVILPIIGVLSDHCTSRFGRRRPFIVGGCAFTMLGFALLYIIKLYGAKLSSTAVSVCMFIVLFINYGAINTIMGPLRALIGDIIPAEQQDLANAVASVLIGLSSVLPNLVGGMGYFIRDPSYAEKADSFTIIFCIATIFVCVAITCFAAKEETLPPSAEKMINPFKDIFMALKNVPKPVLMSFFLIILSWVSNYMFTMMGTNFFMTEVFSEEESAKGLCFGMLVIASSNAFAFLYGCLHVSISECIGYRTTYAISHIVEAISLASVFFIHDPWYLFISLTPIGMSIANFNSTPFAIVGLACDDRTMGIYMSMLSTCIDVAYITANCLMNLAGGNIYEALHKSDWKVTKLQGLIGSSSVFALITAVYSMFVIIPEDTINLDKALLIAEKEIISKVPEDDMNEVIINKEL